MTDLTKLGTFGGDEMAIDHDAIAARVRASTFDDGALCDDPCRDMSAASGCICTTTATIIRTLSARLKAVEALDLTPVRDALHQYINDMKYPPERDSPERRIAMAQAALALIDWEKGND